jgi:DNA-binding CsgD family transcriptional regulator
MIALANRRVERARLDSLLATARGGHSAVLVLSGEAGIGKSALLDYVTERATGWRVLRALGVESEMELAFSGLHQLCATLLGDLGRLPGPQREALETAFGLSFGSPADRRFLVSLGVLSLLSDSAAELPLLCLIDDAQWLDHASAQVLAFVARRLAAESVVMLFATREPSKALRGLPELELEGLATTDAHELLASVVRWPLDDRTREQIVAETRGNPLALLELPRGLSPAQLAGGFGLPRARSLSGRIEEAFVRRLEALPQDSRRLVLLAAADPVGDPELLWRAAGHLVLDTDALERAEGAGLLEFRGRVRFRHPLVRSAAYQSASGEERREVHSVLAKVTDRTLDPDHWAWHRAHACSGPDEDVAAELERAASRAQRRGGIAAEAAFLEQATTLTADLARRSQRALAAAHAKQLAGEPRSALRLIGTAESGPLGELERASAKRLQGQIALDLRRAADAVPLLLDAASRLESLDVRRARDTYLEALRAASVAGRLGDGMLEAARAARAAPRPEGPPRANDVLLDGLAIRYTDGYTASVPALKQALDALWEEDQPDVRWPFLARRLTLDLFDDDAWQRFATRNVQIARDRGALAVLPLALNYLARMRCFEGELDAAATLLDEADAIAGATGTEPIVWGRVSLASVRGQEDEATRLFDHSEPAAIERGEGIVLTFIEFGRAMLNNGLAKYETALSAAQGASERDELQLSVWSLPEAIEAAVRSGRAELAMAPLEHLAECARASGTDLALGIEARCRALVSDGVSADVLYQEAIDRLDRTRMRVDVARAHLLYGEWLRRENRRVDARAALRTAYESLAAMGIEAFAERSRRELEATGERVARRGPETRDDLTAQERLIAELAGDGLTNPEIGARLFLSPRTVEWHLRKVFTKLGVSSRRELGDALAGVMSEPGPS